MASKALRSHTRDDLTSVCHVSMCSNHPNNLLELFCETCKGEICAKCSLILHKDHSIVEICKKVLNRAVQYCFLWPWASLHKILLLLVQQNEELVPAVLEALDQAKFLRARLLMSLKVCTTVLSSSCTRMCLI